jgi:hypothetical protein
LGDPQDLSKQEEKNWKEIFLGFLAGVSARDEAPDDLEVAHAWLSCCDTTETAAGYAFCAHRSRLLDKLRVDGPHVANLI